jgi:hypothetical protein
MSKQNPKTGDIPKKEEKELNPQEYLHNLFYNPETGYTNLSKLQQKVASFAQHIDPDIVRKFYRDQEINQKYGTSSTKNLYYHFVAPNVGYILISGTIVPVKYAVISEP